jgi:hypothetical protein
MDGFPLLKVDEDQSRSIGLDEMATDRESAADELAWRFEDPDEQVLVSISNAVPGVGRIARFFPPQDGTGTFLVRAIVTDPAGASDSSVVIMEVAPVNDPPLPPVYQSTPDGVVDISAPFNLSWTASDPDVRDILRYDVLLGTDPNELLIQARALDEPSYSIEGLISGRTYFWQVVVYDSTGLRSASPIQQLVTAELPPSVDRGDLDGDRRVTFRDFAIFAVAYRGGDDQYMLRADLSENGKVDFADFVIFAIIYGTDYTMLVTDSE